MGFLGLLEWKHLDKDGNILAQDINKNALTNQGEQDILETFYLNKSAPPADIYAGLATNVPILTSNLNGIVEVVGTGYGRTTISRSGSGWTSALDVVSGNWQLQSLPQVWQATQTSGLWTQATYVFLTSVQSGQAGRLWNYVALTTPRTLGVGEQLTYTYKIRLI